MRKLCGVVLLLFVFAAAAYADPVTVSVGALTQPTGSIGPYYGNVTDPTGTSFQPLICFSLDNGVGAPWTGGLKYSINTVEAGTIGTWGLTTFDYNVLGYLADQLFAAATNPDNVTQDDLQRAIWKFAGFVPGGVATWFTQFSAADQLLINADIAAAISAVNGGYVTGDFFLFAPNSFPGENESTDGAQPLIERSPEPGSLLLLGSGIFGLAGVVRRKLAR